MSNFEDVKIFMETFGQMVRTKPKFPDEKTMQLRYELIKEELDELEQIAVKQLKNRYNDPFYYKKFVIGLDRSKMKLYDVEDFAQVEVSEDQDDENVIGHNGRKSGFNFEGIQL